MVLTFLFQIQNTPVINNKTIFVDISSSICLIKLFKKICTKQSFTAAQLILSDNYKIKVMNILLN